MSPLLSRRAFLSGAAALPLAAALPGFSAAQPLNAPFTVGGFTVLPILDGPYAMMPMVFPEADSFEGDRLLEAAGLPKAGPWPQPVNVFAIKKGDRTYLIDAGAGATLGPDLGKAGQRLAAVGVDPAKVEAVLMTHLHADHAGGLITADGQAAFPNAELVLQPEEVAFWTDDGALARQPSAIQPMFGIARKALDAYKGRVRTVAGAGQAVPGISFVPLPGVTPGHAGFLLADGKDQFLFLADTIQFAVLQFPRPGWTTGFDIDPSLAAASRRGILDRLVADGTPATGAHIAERGRILSRNLGYAMAG
ncbi:MBL fold metallo-hydrolase [Xanthobacteraceae bacterium A53D]